MYLSEYHSIGRVYAVYFWFCWASFYPTGMFSFPAWYTWNLTPIKALAWLCVADRRGRNLTHWKISEIHTFIQLARLSCLWLPSECWPQLRELEGCQRVQFGSLPCSWWTPGLPPPSTQQTLPHTIQPLYRAPDMFITTPEIKGFACVHWSVSKA